MYSATVISQSLLDATINLGKPRERRISTKEFWLKLSSSLLYKSILFLGALAWVFNIAYITSKLLGGTWWTN